MKLCDHLLLCRSVLNIADLEYNSDTPKEVTATLTAFEPFIDTMKSNMGTSVYTFSMVQILNTNIILQLLMIIVCELKLHFPTKYKQTSLCRTIDQTYKWPSKNSVICGLFSRYFLSQHFCQVVTGTGRAPRTASC